MGSNPRRPLAHGRDAVAFTPAWNGDIVRGAVVIDAHDREIIARRAAAHAGTGGSDIRGVLLEAVQRRVGPCRAAPVIAMPPDKGWPCIATDDRIVARLRGPKPCFTPVRSPQGTGNSEAIVLGPRAANGAPFETTRTRDRVPVTPQPDARSGLYCTNRSEGIHRVTPA